MSSSSKNVYVLLNNWEKVKQFISDKRLTFKG
jgi:hypothetical protein